MRLPRPSLALVVALFALLLAAGGASFAAVRATGSATNIVDPLNPAQIAKVDPTGHLVVGDGGGPLTIDGAVGARIVAPANSFSHVEQLDLNAGEAAIYGPTSATINVTSVSISAIPPVPGSSATGFDLHSWDVPGASVDCNSGVANVQEIWSTYLFAVQPETGTTFPAAVVRKPPSGRKECLATYTYGAFAVEVSVTGYLG